MPRHTFPCPIRWGDMDAYGHVNNVQFVRYLEEARVALFAHLAELHGSFDMLDTGVLVAGHEIRYRRPLDHRAAPVPIQVWVSDIGVVSYDVSYEIADEGGPVYATATTKLVPYDFANARPRRLTAEEKDKLAAVHEPA